MNFNKDKELLRQCRHHWDRMAPFRARRSRCLDYAYGRQWDTPVTLPDGRVVTEEQALISSGRTPISNNLTRQLIKTVIGKWRYMRAMSHPGDDGEPTLERALRGECCRDSIDARALEEFIISGVTAQLLPPMRHGCAEPVNVSPGRIFLAPFRNEDASDCPLRGVLHDLSLSELLRRFGHSDAARHSALVSLFRHSPAGEDGTFSLRCDTRFDTPQAAGCIRVIEVWRRLPENIVRIHDTDNGGYFTAAASPELCGALGEVDRRRKASRRGGLICHNDVLDVWHHCWISAAGDILDSEILKETASPALVVRCYPMIDGEIHSLVEDVMAQQHYVNRLVMLLDEILRFSAKGVLLYPTEQLPKGMTWERLRHIWSSPGGIIPFQRTSSNITPTQLISPGTSAGASEMLKLQLDMFARVSGTSFASDGNGMNVNSADMLRRQMEQEMVALLDVLASFHSFTCLRDSLLGRKEANRE